MINKELLSLVLGVTVIEVTDVCTVQNEVFYDVIGIEVPEFEVAGDNGEYHRRVNLDTLGRRCKEWCIKRGYWLVIGYGNEIQLALYTVGGDIFKDTALYKHVSLTELEAIIKATEWVAKEEGLIL